MLSKSHASILRTCVIYAAISCVWIFAADRLVWALVPDRKTANWVESLEDCGFVIFTAVLLYVLLQGHRRRTEQQAERERAAEAALELFRGLVDHSTDAIFIVDSETSRILDANDTACQRLGYTREELRAITIQEISGRVPNHAVWFDLVQRVEAGGGALVIGGRHSRKDGTTFPVEVSINLVEQDRKRFLVGIVRDITERQHFEEEQRRGEEMMATAQRIARFGSWELELTNPDLNANPLRWSDEAFRVFGYEPHSVEVTNELFFDRIPPEDRELIVEAVARALCERAEYALDHRVVLPDGEVRFVHEHARVFADEQTGRLLKMVGTVHDITERKRAEEQLRRFLSMSPAVLYALKILPDGFQPIWTSENMLRLTGFSEEESLQKDWWFDHLHPEDRERALAAHPRPYEIEHQKLEFRFQRKDGTYLWIHDEKQLVRDAQGRAVEVVGVWTDATERVQLEQQLRQSQKMEAVGTLAGGVAHDFNNLLTVIQGHSSLLLAKPPTHAEMTESINEIAEAAERAANLTRQLLVFSRKQFMELADLDLNEIVSHLGRMLRRILGEDIALELDLAPELPHIHGDHGMIEQAVVNLAVNARDAMPRGGHLRISTASVTVEAKQAAENPDAIAGPCIVLSVRDTGCGIAPEALPHIFEPFFTTKEVGKGTGLGLATAYGIAKVHRGWITVASGRNDGTTFCIHFPAISSPRVEKPVPETLPDVLSGSETILVVEDEPPVRLLLASSLAQYGYQILEASSGTAAVEIWRERKGEIDLLLTDMVMPDGMTGRDLADRLLRERTSLKVIFTSGYSPETAGNGVPLAEGVNFLQKPFNPQRLARTVRAALDRE